MGIVQSANEKYIINQTDTFKRLKIVNFSFISQEDLKRQKTIVLKVLSRMLGNIKLKSLWIVSLTVEIKRNSRLISY